MACLRSLARVRGADIVTVVVDNASRDGTPSVVAREFPGVTVLPLPENLGFTGGNNVGIRWCLDRGCDAVLILNNDTIVNPDLIERMLPRLAIAGIAVPTILSASGDPSVGDGIGWFDWQLGLLRPLSRPVPTSKDGLPTRVSSGCCLLIRREVFDRIGLFDENFFLYFEDLDLLVRAQLNGFAVVHEPGAVVYHHGSASSGGTAISPLTLYYNNRNRIYFMRKYSRAGVTFISYFTLTRLAYAVRYALGGEWALLRSMLRGVHDGMRGRLARGQLQAADQTGAVT
jgi:GT2 family glycosyltransferase